MRPLALAVMVGACTASHGAQPDASIDGGVPIATSGTRLVDHYAVVGGVTRDGYVAYYDFDGSGHTVAEVVPISGGTATPIATSDGSGKLDIRFETVGSMVFAWTDRGNRVSKLTIWSSATGVVPIGSDVRPGRAGAVGSAVLYESVVTASSADIVAGALASPMLVGSANTADADCWQDTDLANAGERLLARYCEGSATAFSLISVALDGSGPTTLSSAAIDAHYGSSSVVWLEASGALDVAAPDGTAAVTLGSGATAFTVSPDETTVAWLTGDGAIYESALTGSASLVVGAPLAKQLGALSPDDQTVLFASQVVDMGSGYIQPYTDVLAARPGNAPITLVATPTSCPSCSYDSFTSDGAYALVIDPIDNSSAADGAGPIRVFAMSDGTNVATFADTTDYSAVATTGASAVVLDATREASLESGWAYGLALQSALGSASVIATGAENFAFDATLTNAVTSFAGGSDVTGIWVTPL